MTQKPIHWLIQVLGDRSAKPEIVHAERFFGTMDKAIDRALLVIRYGLRVDISAV